MTGDLCRFVKMFTGSENYDYICVLDFEATCEKDYGGDFPHEVIEV